MKKFRLLVLAFAAMLAGTQNGVAQDWSGHDPENLLDATGEDAEVYLWNVGTGQFLYSGGLWGTQAITYDTGTPFTVKNPVNGHRAGWWESSFYCSLESPFQANNKATYLSLTDGTDASSKHDDGIWFVDRNVSQATTPNQTTEDLLTLKLLPVRRGSTTYNICSEPSRGGFGVKVSIWLQQEEMEWYPFQLQEMLPILMHNGFLLRWQIFVQTSQMVLLMQLMQDALMPHTSYTTRIS